MTIPPPQKAYLPRPVLYRLEGEPQVLNPDGTWGTPLPVSASYAQDMLRDADELELDVEVAAKLAVMEVLLGVTAREIHWPKLVEGADVDGEGRRLLPPVIKFTAQRISLDWPEQEQEEPPSLSATIRAGEAGLDYEGLGLSGAQVLDDTADVYAPGTVLEHRHDVTGVLVIDMLCASKTIRDGVRAALKTAFSKEPHDNRGGRRIVVRPYFDRTCRIELARRPFAVPDSPEEAHGKRFPLLVFLDIDINDVHLVARPPYADRPPIPRLYVSGA